MNYYKMDNDWLPKKVGKFPQVEEAKFDFNVWDEPANFIENFHFVKIDIEPKVGIAVLSKGAKLTDLISASIVGFSKKLLVSGKLKNVISPYAKIGLQFFQSGILFNNVLLEDYWILNSYKIEMDRINFEKSSIVFRKRRPEGGTYLENADINSLDAFQKVLSAEKKDFRQCFIQEIVLKNDTKDDFFTLLNVKGGFQNIVSERLKYEIEDAECTGMTFELIETG